MQGGLKSSRKMAKKTIPAALQTEISNNEEWEKLLKRTGLIVVDVYSEWSGPCTGMVSILKKVKMEIGGDTLSYATVIVCLLYVFCSKYIYLICERYKFVVAINLGKVRLHHGLRALPREK